MGIMGKTQGVASETSAAPMAASRKAQKPWSRLFCAPERREGWTASAGPPILSPTVPPTSRVSGTVSFVTRGGRQTRSLQVCQRTEIVPWPGPSPPATQAATRSSTSPLNHW